MTTLEHALEIIAGTQPLAHPRGNRIPFIVWRLTDLQGDDAELEHTLRELDARGIATVTTWHYGARDKDLPRCLHYAGILKRLGLPVVVNTTSVVNRFFNGDERTAHIDADGNPFFDLSHSERVKIGCPFAVEFRYQAIRAQVETYVKAHHERGLPLDILIADWEIDGPIEWNDAWTHAKRCTRCCKSIPDIDDFHAFQAAYRRIRNEMQRQCYADVVRSLYPNTLVGNYAEYPNDGRRHWYDYFEHPPKREHPHTLDHLDPVRPWINGFADTHYTFAMPVVYTWHRIHGWYPWPESDYRWFYSMLKVVTNSGRSAPAALPVISFVHWHTTSPPKNGSAAPQMSERAYSELLWHMFLRGHDALAMWCTDPETLKETQLVQTVYAQALEHAEFLDKGTPVLFDVPAEPGTVVSALKLGKRLLVRRTDFRPDPTPVQVNIDGVSVAIPAEPGNCQILQLP
ncbi:MAG: hypothetical protein KAI66_08755 [Lentisphaeria bacterium]|nr:hypothetical protein [Lentisphaeria bacterium]